MPGVHPRLFKLEFLEMGAWSQVFFKRASVDSIVGLITVV